MMGKKFGNIALSGVVSILGISAVQAAVPVSEVVSLPTDAAYGGGDKVGSQLLRLPTMRARVRVSGLWPMAATGSTITVRSLPRITRRAACALCR